MGTLLWVGWTNLRRDRVAQMLTFLLPIVFFSIFATVFGGQGDVSTARIRIAVVDEDRSEVSARLINGLKNEKGLRTQTTADAAGAGAALDRGAAERLVRNGDVPVAVVIPAGIGDAFSKNGFAGGGPSIQLLSDVSDRIAPQMVLGLLQKVAMTAAPDLLMRGGMQQFEKYAGAMTPQQKSAVDAWLPRLKAQGMSGANGSSEPSTGAMPIGVEVVDVMRTDNRRGSLISFYAAGIGVMFLLFSSVGGAGGALLEEAEAGTLERLLSTNIGMTGVLVGKWILLALIGCLQLTVMFLWGRVAFGLPLFSHLPGFVGHDGRHRIGRGSSRARARHARKEPRAVVRLLDDPYPHHVSARRQHVSALPDEREHAEGGPADVQRLGPRWVLEDFLAPGRRLGALATSAGARQPRGGLPHACTATRATVGNGLEDC